MADTSQPMSTGEKVGIVAAVAAAFAAMSWVVCSSSCPDGRPRTLARVSSDTGLGPGWYSIHYSDPPRHRDRRVKGFGGPYATKAEAQRNAERNRDIWYPVVRRLSNDPQHLREFDRRRRRR